MAKTGDSPMNALLRIAFWTWLLAFIVVVVCLLLNTNNL